MTPALRTTLLSLAAASLSTFSAPAWADMALAQKKNCMACHAVDRKIVGPSFKEVATKYAKDKKAEALLAEKIVKGGKGVWGEMAMPPNANLSPAEAKALAKWVLATK
ncbi:MAG: c-type cytochrome [Inhella sp.]|jgi:cytochrome c|uniref:c-type cytochrome n=1 Tax=Inhella sp. TaxID=1921806 RepID=UPI0022BD840A|nr:c-type cytochrome [Inhella sp.]MCZ8236713.1 c-type cytochrome [Inhella sp.]